MLTKQDFSAAIADSVDAFPAIGPLYVAKDPSLLLQLDVMASMLAMISAQIEVAGAEPFFKSRDATILADAAQRGIFNKGSSASVVISASNTTEAPITIAAGDLLSDSLGNDYVAGVTVTVPAATWSGLTLIPGAATFSAIQKKVVQITHTVATKQPFYKIEIPEQDGLFIAALTVTDAVGNVYEYRNSYVNCNSGDLIYHVETDEKRRLFIVFGMAHVAGVQHAKGTVINISVTYCAGEITGLAAGSPFSLNAPSDLDLTLSSITDNGSNPLPIGVLRELCKYPAIYDESAVFLGEFGYLINRNFPDMKFVSVWNEAIEEQIRGANVDNVNTLFVACYQSAESYLVETDPVGGPVAPTVITSLTAAQISIKALLNRADSSYRVKFLTPVVAEIHITITAKVSTSFIPDSVKSRIKSAILAEFGQSSSNAKRNVRPTERRIHELLKASITEIADRRTELNVTIPAYTNDSRPELYRYVTAASLAVTVTSDNAALPIWG